MHYHSQRSVGVEGGQSSVQNSAQSLIDDLQDSSMKESKSSFVERLRKSKLSRQRSCHDERVLELRDQNQYLTEKVQFLKLHKMRNENELVRMDTKQRDLQKIHDNYVSQIGEVEDVMGDFQELYEELKSASTTWKTKSESAPREYVHEIV